VGDSELDCRAADAAGIPFVSYKSDLPSVARIDRHEQLLEFIGNGCFG